MNDKRESLKSDEAKINYDKLDNMYGIGIESVFPWKNVARIYVAQNYTALEVSLVETPENKSMWLTNRLHFFEDYVVYCIFERGIREGRLQMQSEFRTLIGVKQ